MSKKTKKSKDLSKCCKKCRFYDDRNKEQPICSISAEQTAEDHVCKNFNSEVFVECMKCGKNVKYTSKEEYWNGMVKFSLKCGNGNSCFQHFHLCKKCEQKISDMFCDFLDGILNKKDRD